MAHSKRNTSRAVFTSHERALAKSAWSSTSARLNRDSFLPFAYCRLCLENAIDPVSCLHGDLYCRECALSNILAQKKEIKRLEKVLQQEEREQLEAKARQEAEAQERAIREFELTQAGLDVKASKGSTRAKSIQEHPPSTEVNGVERRGEKRKFSLDADEVERIAAEERTKARRAIEDEKSAKPTLPSFWTPSVTPSSNKHNVLHDIKKKTKTQPICPASPEDQPHYYSLHTLITVNFTEEKDEKTKTSTRICPACKKALSNSSKAMLAKPCGHVVCGSCVKTFMNPQGHHDPHAPHVDPEAVQCYVCEAVLTEKAPDKKEKEGKEKVRPGLVEIRREGTGFSAGGQTQAQKNGVSFQC
ncbi:ENOS interacting protein [Coniochaeta sp. PMI_546]|nr:ENOS interacting protein [Coniochaeta sp. PMI_546]